MGDNTCHELAGGLRIEPCGRVTAALTVAKVRDLLGRGDHAGVTEGEGKKAAPYYIATPSLRHI